jgi:hypothetical protein
MASTVTVRGLLVVPAVALAGETESQLPPVVVATLVVKFSGAAAEASTV